MTIRTKATYGAGVLRPLVRLSRAQHQVVSLSISTESDDVPNADGAVRDYFAFF